ncbi:MAG: substrate-binding domain-containing protein, partial [Pseudomonadota bacterium]
GLIAAACEMKIPVGREPDCRVRIAGHDDHPFSRFTSPPLTTVAQDYSAISGKSVEVLFSLIETRGDLSTREETLFEGKLVMRGSA